MWLIKMSELIFFAKCEQNKDLEEKKKCDTLFLFISRRLRHRQGGAFVSLFWQWE